MRDYFKRLSIAIVAGDWNENGGRPSSYADKLYKAIVHYGPEVFILNGGLLSDLNRMLQWKDTLSCFKVILWMPNVPNELPKYRDVKTNYPHSILVTTKRNNESDGYIFQDLLQRSLAQKANLTIDFRKGNEYFEARLFDPLGTVWQDYTFDIDLLAKSLLTRLSKLILCTRKNTHKRGCLGLDVPEHLDFFHLIREYADIFHRLVHPSENVERFLGNAAFRCVRGFPSFRDKDSDLIFISKRDVDKRYIDQGSFVATQLVSGEVTYWGPNKPSVDSPIQLRIFDRMPNVNYMLHGHVYLEDAPFTSEALPCGALEEFEAVVHLINDTSVDYYALNLLGHGFIAMANRVDQLRGLRCKSRPVPEFL